jgi:hypothetical protein
VFRNGIIETVDSAMLPPRLQGETWLLPSRTFTDALIEFVERARRLMRAIAIELPASMFISLLGVRGQALGLNQKLVWQDHHARPFDRDNILFRDVLLTDWDSDAHVVLKPLLDELWQAAGLERCYDYDVNGNWHPIL